MKRFSLLLVLAVLSFSTVGCTDAYRASVSALGDQGTVILYSGGVEVGRWFSTGKITSGDHGTRFAFKDKESGKYIRVMGDVVVLQGVHEAKNLGYKSEK